MEKLMTINIIQKIIQLITKTISKIIMQTIMLTTSITYQSYADIIQIILQYQPTHNRNHNTLLVNQHQRHHHKSPIIPMKPTAINYKRLRNCHIAIPFNYHRQSTTTSKAHGSRPAPAGMKQITTLHQHIPNKQGCSLASAVFRHYPTLRTQSDQHKPSMKTPS